MNVAENVCVKIPGLPVWMINPFIYRSDLQMTVIAWPTQDMIIWHWNRWRCANRSLRLANKLASARNRIFMWLPTMREHRCVWNCIVWVVRASEISKRNVTTMGDGIRHRGCTFRAFQQPENLHTWKHCTIEVFPCPNHMISIDIAWSWNWSTDTHCTYWEELTRSHSREKFISNLFLISVHKFTKWKTLKRSTMI